MSGLLQWQTDDRIFISHYSDVIMIAMASQITSLTIVYSTVYSGAYQRKYQRSASLAFVQGIHRWPVNTPHKGPVTRKIFPFDDVIMMRQQLKAPPRENCVQNSTNILTCFLIPIHACNTGSFDMHRLPQSIKIWIIKFTEVNVMQL